MNYEQCLSHCGEYDSNVDYTQIYCRLLDLMENKK